MNFLFKYLLARLTEGSTWAGFAATATSYAMTLPDGALKTAMLILAGAMGSAAGILKDKGAKS